MDAEFIYQMNMIMKIIFMIIAAVAIWYAPAKAQNVVKWKFTSKKIGDKLYEVRLSAEVDEEWHIYSQNTPTGGPLPTKVGFNKNALVVLDGKVKEDGNMKVYHDKVFDVDVYAYGDDDKVDFVQVVKLKSNAKTKVNGTVEFMACTKERCLTPQTKEFSVVVGG